MAQFNRRDIMKAAGIGMLSGLSGSVLGQAASRTATNKKMNVILYVADDQGMQDAGCYGNTVVKTPGLDALAAEGVMFSHAFCTTASCSASRSVILTGKHNHATGQYGHTHGYNHFSTLDHIVSLPTIMKQNGYLNINIGKYHVAPELVYPFDVQHPAANPEQMAESARPYIANANEKPFFLYFGTAEPHRPFLRETSDTFSPEEAIVPSYLPDIPESRQELAEYYGSIQQADKGLVRLMQILKEAGQWDNTIILYLSDNGAAFPGAKTNVYEPAIRLPFVVRHPDAKRTHITNHAMISYTDVTPTILDMVGLMPKDADFHGRSFLPILEEENSSGWDKIYASHTFHEVTMYYPMRVVRNRQYKLIWNIAHKLDYPFASDLWASAAWQGTLKRGLKTYGKRTVEACLHRAKFELYDLQKDPDESCNLADHPDYQVILAALKADLKAFQIKTDDPWVLKWDHE